MPLLNKDIWHALRQHKARWVLLLLCFGLLTFVPYTLYRLWETGWLNETNAELSYNAIEETANLGLRVENIDVNGRNRISRQELLEALDIHKDDPILGIDLAATQERLETISWVRSASIERILPNTIKVNLIEREPMALWQIDNRLMLIDYMGEILTLENLHLYKEYPLIVGPGAPKAAPEILLYLEKLPKIKDKLYALSYVGQRRWNLHLKNGMIVKLPEDNIKEHLYKLKKLINQDHILEKQIKTIDLRYIESTGQLILRKESSVPHLMDRPK